jgi:hypothetical protein
MDNRATTFLADDPINHPVSAHPLYSHPCRLVLRRGGRIQWPLRGSAHRRERAENLREFRPPPTPNLIFFCDSEVAIDLANRTACLKMSKSLDMRFHWLRDRIDQGQFCVVFVPGKKNLADFFTKALPVARHKVLVPFFAVDGTTIL